MPLRITEATTELPAIKWTKIAGLLDDEDGNDLYEATGIGTDGTTWYGIWVQERKGKFLRIEQIKPA